MIQCFCYIHAVSRSMKSQPLLGNLWKSNVQQIMEQEPSCSILLWNRVQDQHLKSRRSSEQWELNFRDIMNLMI